MPICVFLDYRDDVAPDLVGEHGGLDELGVLEAIADDRRLVVRERHDRQQLRLGTCLEPEAVRLPEVEDFLDDLALLIHLDRIHARVLALVLVLGDCRVKRRVNVAEPVFEDVGEADENGEADAAKLKAIDQLFEVDGPGRVLRRMYLDVAGLVHGEVAVAPAGHLVELARVVDAPAARRVHRGGRTAGSVGGRTGTRPVGNRRAAVGRCTHLEFMIDAFFSIGSFFRSP
jgi:hypothetical protein